MGDSELEELIKRETDLSKIIDFCQQAALYLGEETWRRDYGMNSGRGIEFTQRLYDYRGFDIDLHDGAYGAYGEWNKLKLSYKDHLVLDVEYSGKDDFKVISFSKDKEWRSAILALAGQKGLLTREKNALEKKKKLEAAEEQRRLEIVRNEEEKREADERRKEGIRKRLNGF